MQVGHIVMKITPVAHVIARSEFEVHCQIYKEAVM